MAPRTGRPVSENSKTEKLTLRLSTEEKSRIKKCADLLGTTQTNAIMYSVDATLKKLEK